MNYLLQTDIQQYPPRTCLPAQFYHSPYFEGGQKVACAFDVGDRLVGYAPRPVSGDPCAVHATGLLFAPLGLRLIRLGLIHYQFEAICPFLDGNGRVGRLLISLLLCAWKLLPQPLLYLSAYCEANRQTYYQHLLNVSQTGAWEAWLGYFLQGVQSQASRASTRVLQVVDFLFEKPVLTIQQVADKLGVYFPSAQHYVEQLEQAGILREITGQMRNRLYRADEILLTVDAPLEAHSKDYKGPVYLTAPCTKTPIIWI